jgi:Uma2 family endonuclease
MVPARALAASPDPSGIDQRIHMHDVSWQAYEALLAWRGESSALRMTYLEGELEIMSPSWSHESLKKRLARLLEAWADETDVALEGAGSWTLKNRAAKRGAEPDECYVLGPVVGEPARPDIAIEVVWTRGGIDKLEVYRKLEVPEVWIWQDGELSFHLLRGPRYARAAKSALLPAFDPARVAPFMTSGTQSEAVKAFRKVLRAGARKPARRR